MSGRQHSISSQTQQGQPVQSKPDYQARVGIRSQKHTVLTPFHSRNKPRRMQPSGLEMVHKCSSTSCSYRSPGLSPSTHVVTHSHPLFQFQRLQSPLLISKAPGTHMVHIYIPRRQNIHTHKSDKSKGGKLKETRKMQLDLQEAGEMLSPLLAPSYPNWNKITGYGGRV